MPVYNSPPVVPSANVTSEKLYSKKTGSSSSSNNNINILLTPTAAALMSTAGAAHLQPQSPEHTSPSVIWVDATSKHTPSAVASASALRQQFAPAQSWLQLRGALEASLSACVHGTSLAQVDAAQDDRSAYLVLETEIALMQARGACQLLQ